MGGGKRFPPDFPSVWEAVSFPSVFLAFPNQGKERLSFPTTHIPGNKRGLRESWTEEVTDQLVKKGILWGMWDMTERLDIA